MLGYYVLEDERTVNHAIRDTESLGASYDRYLRDGVILMDVIFFYSCVTILLEANLKFSSRFLLILQDSLLGLWVEELVVNLLMTNE